LSVPRRDPNLVRLLWDEGLDVRETPARLVDVSVDGARFVAEMVPPRGRDVCFRVETPMRSPWVLARVVRIDGSMGGLSFADYSPQDLVDCVA